MAIYKLMNFHNDFVGKDYCYACFINEEIKADKINGLYKAHSR